MHRRAFLTGALAVAAAPALPAAAKPILDYGFAQKATVFVPNRIYRAGGRGIFAMSAAAQEDLNKWNSDRVAALEFFRGDRWTDEQAAKMYSRTAGYEG